MQHGSQRVSVFFFFSEEEGWGSAQFVPFKCRKCCSRGVWKSLCHRSVAEWLPLPLLLLGAAWGWGQEELSPWEQQGLLVRRWCVRPNLLGWGNAVLLPVQHDLLLLGNAGYRLSSP